MSVFLVTWDLNRAKPNYAQARENFISHLERYGHIKDPGLDSVWFISSSHSAEQISADVRTRLDDNDRLFVTKVIAGQHYGWLHKSTWDWISERI